MTEGTTFGVLLRRSREQAGLTHEQLAERAQVSASAIAALERGRRQHPYPDTVRRLAVALSLSDSDQAALTRAARRPNSAEAAPELTSRAAPGRWPDGLTSFIGRDTDVPRVGALLDPDHPSTRLVTLTGPGGVGKTRLAIAVATQLANRFADGAVFVDLSPLRDARLVPATIARSLGLGESDGRSARDIVIDFLLERQVLLVIDNFEHLLSAARVVADVQAACRRVHVLVTSRTLLHLRGEQRFAVPPLTAPDEATRSLETLAAAPAVRLFVERARAVVPEFELDLSNAPTVAAICRRLDGLPLAVELAAARMGLVSPEDLLRRLQQRMPLLTGGPVDLPERQQTLRMTLAWSHDLLGLGEQVLFRRLAVFVGGWTLSAAEAVCASDDLPMHEVLDGLGALVDSSLVQRTGKSGGEPRFRMLETIREYASELLAGSAELAATARRHRHWCLALAAPLAAEVPHPLNMARLDADQDNLRAALRNAIDDGAAEDGLRLAVALDALWFVRGTYTEGRTWFSELLAMPGAKTAPSARAYALAAAGQMTYCQGDYATAEALIEEAGQLADQLGDAFLRGIVLHFEATIARWRGDLERTGRLYNAALDAFRQDDHPLWEALVLVHLAIMEYEQGNPDLAASHARASLALFEAAGNTWGTSRAQRLLGRVAAGRGDRAEARSRLEASLALDRALGDHHDAALSLLALGDLVAADGGTDAARSLYSEGLELAYRAGNRWLLALSLERIGGLVVGKSTEKAVRLAGAADSLRTTLGAVAPAPDRVRLDEWLEAARRDLGRLGFSEAWAAGRTSGVTRAVAEALEATPAAPVGRREPI
jgi:predicted ATPase/transcriptional regulator with XRE-family HTH domain